MSAVLKRRDLRRDEASRYLFEVHGISFKPQTIAKMACSGGGPRFFKIGKYPLYPVDELDKWVAERRGELQGSTSS